MPNGTYIAYVCNGTAVTAAGCSGVQICSQSVNTSPYSCTYQVGNEWNGEQTFYVGIVDDTSNVSLARSFNWAVNNPPTLSTVDLSVLIDNANSNKYVCTASGISDPDGDSIATAYSFIDADGFTVQPYSGSNKMIK